MTLRNKQYLTQGDFSKKDREPSDHLKMPERLYDRVFLFLRHLRRPAVLTLRRRHIHLVHIDLHADVILCLRKFGQKTYRLNMLRSLIPTEFYTFRVLKRLYLRGFSTPFNVSSLAKLAHTYCSRWQNGGNATH